MPEALSVQLTLTLTLTLALTLTRAGYARGAERAAGGRRWVRVRVRVRARVRSRARVWFRARVKVRVRITLTLTPSPKQVADALELTQMQGRVWYIQACSAQSGDGVSDGLDWLADKLAAKAKQAKKH